MPRVEPPPPSPQLQRVLASAARLQRLVPDAVVVGGTAAALYAAHRVSYDHGHVIADLARRFDAVLDALESDGDWVTNRVVPGKVILGNLGGIEAGVRQLIRRIPLETQQIRLPSGEMLTVPTFEETLRIKSALVVRRNQVRDYLDVAALADVYGAARAAGVLTTIDDFYTDPRVSGRPVASQIVRQFADPRPADSRTLRRLGDYKGLADRWRDWSSVAETLADVATLMVAPDEARS